jgi:hypothetical protein
VIRRVRAIEFQRQTINGKCTPAILVAEASDGCEIELVAKLAPGCFEGVRSLAREVVCACLAHDLGIRVPEPFFVEMSPLWLSTIHDRSWAAKAQNGPLVAFGSKHISGGYAAWQQPRAMSDTMISAVAAALAFDCAIENSDRRPENPNCLHNGEYFYLFDHELCFPAVLIGQLKPWAPGGLRDFETAGRQIFADALRGRNVDWRPIVERWNRLSDVMIDDYGRDLPGEWLGAGGAVSDARAKIRQARDSIDGLVGELRRVLA